MNKKRRKRWMKARQKDDRRTRFIRAFRECFVRKGIL